MYLKIRFLKRKQMNTQYQLLAMVLVKMHFTVTQILQKLIYQQ